MRKTLAFHPLADTRIRTKLAVLVVVLAAPLLVLLYLQYNQRQGEIAFAQSEANGLNYVAAALPLLRDVQQHRALAEKFLSGDSATKDALARSTAAVEDSLAKVSGVDRKFGGAFKTHTLVADIATQWAALRETPAGSTADANSAAHTALIQGTIMPLISQVAGESKLVLEPDSASRSIIVALTDSLPAMTEGVARARSFGAATLLQRAGRPADNAQKQFLTGQVIIASTAAEKMTRQLEAGMAGNKEFESAIRPLLERSSAARQNFLGSVDRDILNADTLQKVETESYFLLGGSVIDSSNKILDASTAILLKDFEARVSHARSNMLSAGVATTAAMALAIVLVVVLAATITRPMSHLVDVADRMSLGELDVEIDVEGKNEIGQLAESLRRMQASLRSAIERLRARRAA